MQNLAARYASGNEVPLDPAQAAAWHDKAAAQEIKNAAADLQSAESGNIDAMRKIADRYDDGQGVEKDLAKAQEWRNRATAAEKKKAADAREAALRKQREDFKFMPMVSSSSRDWDGSSSIFLPIVSPIASLSDLLSLPSKTTDYAKIANDAAYGPSKFAKPGSMIAKAADFQHQLKSGESGAGIALE
jgi:hypothetical protein